MLRRVYIIGTGRKREAHLIEGLIYEDKSFPIDLQLYNQRFSKIISLPTENSIKRIITEKCVNCKISLLLMWFRLKGTDS